MLAAVAQCKPTRSAAAVPINPRCKILQRVDIHHRADANVEKKVLTPASVLALSVVHSSLIIRLMIEGAWLPLPLLSSGS